jgi:hypothetical protein
MRHNAWPGSPAWIGSAKRPCPVCGETVWLNSRGVIVEHMRPRTGPIPLGCKASNHRPTAVQVGSDELHE